MIDRTQPTKLLILAKLDLLRKADVSETKRVIIHPRLLGELEKRTSSSGYTPCGAFSGGFVMESGKLTSKYWFFDR